MGQNIVRILFVENSTTTRVITHRILKNLGYTVTSVCNAEKALELFDQGEEFELLFADINLPGGMDGVTLASTAKKRYPTLKILFTSGMPILTDEQLNELSAHYISKPYQRKELVEKLGGVLSDA